MADAERTVAEVREENDRLRAQVERLRAVAEAADQASLKIDEDIRTLEPQVNNMQEAANALTILVNLTGSVQRTLVAALNELQPGDRTGTSSDQHPVRGPPATTVIRLAGCHHRPRAGEVSASGLLAADVRDAWPVVSLVNDRRARGSERHEDRQGPGAHRVCWGDARIRRRVATARGAEQP